MKRSKKGSKEQGAEPLKAIWEKAGETIHIPVSTPKWEDFLSLQRRFEKLSIEIVCLWILFICLSVWNIVLVLNRPEMPKNYEEKIEASLESYGRTHTDQAYDIKSLTKRLDHAIRVQDKLFENLGVEAYKTEAQAANWNVGKVDPKRDRGACGSPTCNEIIAQYGPMIFYGFEGEAVH